MKKIQELLLESEQLRLETDDAGPQDELEYWKSRAARLTLLVEQINTHPCKMTLVTLKAAQCKLLKVGSSLSLFLQWCLLLKMLSRAVFEYYQTPCIHFCFGAVKSIHFWLPIETYLLLLGIVCRFVIQIL